MHTEPTDRQVPRRKNGTRITVTIPPAQYQRIVQLAQDKKVSASWVVRDAVDKYLEGNQPKGTASLEEKS